MKKMCVCGGVVKAQWTPHTCIASPLASSIMLSSTSDQHSLRARPLHSRMSTVHPAFSHHDVPAFTTGECVSSLELPTNPTTIDIIPQAQSPSSPLSLKPQHTHLHIKRSSTSWNFKGHQSDHDNMTKCKLYCLKGNQWKYQRPPLL